MKTNTMTCIMIFYTTQGNKLEFNYVSGCYYRWEIASCLLFYSLCSVPVSNCPCLNLCLAFRSLITVHLKIYIHCWGPMNIHPRISRHMYHCTSIANDGW